MSLQTITWEGKLDGCVRMVDQTLLPSEMKLIECRDVECMWEAIRSLRVRGAPAIGIAAAMGLVLGVRDVETEGGGDFRGEVEKVAKYLGTSRPTAVNLFWALERMKKVAERNKNRSVQEIKQALLDEARAILEEDRAICRNIGKHGSSLLSDGDCVLTHCNAGGLATSGYGTALAVIFSAHEQGKRLHVFVDETRPLLQGARLTTWELIHAGVDSTLICDNAAASVMRTKGVRCVIVGADRIAANGDTANKIGTYGLAVMAREHGVPFYVAAPCSTFDLSLESGEAIPIEECSPDEVTEPFGVRIAPQGVNVYSPAFDVTPAQYIAAIVTEKGIVREPYKENIGKVVGGD